MQGLFLTNVGIMYEQAYNFAFRQKLELIQCWIDWPSYAWNIVTILLHEMGNAQWPFFRINQISVLFNEENTWM